jgi:hypothetical protein
MARRRRSLAAAAGRRLLGGAQGSQDRDEGLVVVQDQLDRGLLHWLR